MENVFNAIANSASNSVTAVIGQGTSPNMSPDLAAKSMSNIAELQRNTTNGDKQIVVVDGPMAAGRSNETIKINGSMSLPAGPPPEDSVTITIVNTGTTDGYCNLFDVADLHKFNCDGCTTNSFAPSNITAYMGAPSCNALQSFYKQVEKFRYPVLSIIIEDETAGEANPRLGMQIRGTWRNGGSWVQSNVLDTRRQRDLKQIAQDTIYVSPAPGSLFSVLDYTALWRIPVRAGQTLSFTFNFGPRAQAN